MIKIASVSPRRGHKFESGQFLEFFSFTSLLESLLSVYPWKRLQFISFNHGSIAKKKRSKNKIFKNNFFVYCKRKNSKYVTFDNINVYF